MTFADPGALLFLLLVPCIAALYVWTQRRRRRYTLRYSALSLVREAAGARPSRRRHAAAALYLLAVSALVAAAARPEAPILSPRASGTVILVLDVSGSMRNTDIAPSRIEAARAAIKKFVEKEPKGIKIGVVAFAAGAVLVTPPTEHRKQVLTSVNLIQLTRGTNIGAGLRVAIEALTYSDDEAVAAAPSGPPQAADPPIRLGPSALNAAAATIVLLSDGASTTGPDPVQVAQEIALLGVKTHTVGLGTRQPVSFGGGGSMAIDEATLKGIATVTGGTYFNAENAKELSQVYGKIAREHQLAQEITDVTFAFGAMALLVLLAGLGLGAVFQSKLP